MYIRKYRRIFLLIALTSLVTTYNACSGGFSIDDSLLSEAGTFITNSTQLPSGAPPLTVDDLQLVTKGETLYKNNCAMCHADIKKSSVPTFTADGIFYALNNVGSMEMFKNKMSYDDAVAIGAALDHNLPKAEGFQNGQSLNFTCNAQSTAGQDRFYRLTSSEYQNVLKDLLPGIANDSQIQNSFASMGQDDLTRNVEGFTETHHPGFFAGQFKIAKRAAELLSANASLRSSILGSCASSSTITSSCISNILDGFGLKVYRRPLTNTEKQSIQNLFTKYSASSSLTGLEVVITRLLASPHMAFKVELGTTPMGNKVRLSDYEVASRISFRITGTLPDSQLFAAAANGDLQNLSEVRTHIRRLLKTSKAREKKNEMIAYYTALHNVANPNAHVANKANISTSGLREEMQKEILDFADHVISARDGSFYDLMTSDQVFPLSARMAKILETSVTTPGTPVKTSRLHRGLLLRPGLLASSDQRTDILHRGLAFRRQFLCTLGNGTPPDPETIAAASADIKFDELPNRTGASKATGAPQCITCHAIFNPLAYTLEAHDQLGMIRNEEPIFDTNGNVIKTFPIDTTVTRSYIDRQNDTALNDAGDMVEKFGTSHEANSCFVARAFTYYHLKGYDADKDGCALKEAADAAIARRSIETVIENMVGSENIFWRTQ